MKLCTALFALNDVLVSWLLGGGGGGEGGGAPETMSSLLAGGSVMKPASSDKVL